MKARSILILAVILASVSACKKDKHNPQLTGTYTGMFDARPDHPTNGAAQPGPFAVQLIISGDNFQSGQSAAYITVGGGAVQATGSTLNFTDLEAFPDNTSINSEAALSNSYSYTLKGDSLLFSKTELNVTYTYKLKKQ
ncbi:hypothetical protein KXD93_24940 [Mucilaginibacter sp. BJC16-A38]|uniref:hypothetical protein n=1 Tax=Mucilaginibacter phenanthrenivorans TaxID=1234842 RepID=UPI0021581A1F|nr:hypothetical protein [Mucilaginibacter phenanthrenivorans]MCR8560928.1 hypothetical protein [Mucilaginibacter phenanthrenivorans]